MRALNWSMSRSDLCSDLQNNPPHLGITIPFNNYNLCILGTDKRSSGSGERSAILALRVIWKDMLLSLG